MLIDTPGLRELGVAESFKMLESTFEIIFTLSNSCKYSDCTHLIEPECAVLMALGKNEIDQSYYDNFNKNPLLGLINGNILILFEINHIYTSFLALNFL